MIALLTSDAVALVRKNMDELDPNSSMLYDTENGSAQEYGDNQSLDDIVARNLPEAINAVNLAAPVQLLEGKEHSFAAGSVAISNDGVMSVDLGAGSTFLRLVAFQAADSAIVVTDTLAEASAEGRKQLNTYVRGRADRPRLVISQGKHSGPVLKYYSLTTPVPIIYWINGVVVCDGNNYPAAIKQFTYVEEQFYPGVNIPVSEQSTKLGYYISRCIRQNIIDYLTAVVLETYGDQRAQTFYQKATQFPNI